LKRSVWIAAALVLAALAAASAALGATPATAKGTAKSKAAQAETRAEPLPGSALAKCLKSGRPTMADFGRGWCKPCKAMVPILDRAARDYRGKANIVFVEMGEYEKLARQYRIAFMPTQIFFDAKGKEMSRHIGYLDNKGINEQFAKMGAKK
jgi:thioredoxin 1